MDGLLTTLVLETLAGDLVNALRAALLLASATRHNGTPLFLRPDTGRQRSVSSRYSALEDDQAEGGVVRLNLHYTYP